MTAPRLRVVNAKAYERFVTFRMPFRFGAAEVHAAPQAFVCLTVEDPAGRRASGWAAEMMMPRWFDKSPILSVEDNINQLRVSVSDALLGMQQAAANTAFGLHAQTAGDHHANCAAKGLGGLVAGFGQALGDRAVLDALCRMHDISAPSAIRANLAGIDLRLTPDLDGFDLPAFLAARPIPERIEARHTVGLGDPLCAHEIAHPLDDGLPQSLDQVIERYGHRFFKLKLAGDPAADLLRLARIVAVLDKCAPGYRATLDGNEQYPDTAALTDLLDGLAQDDALATLRAGLLFVEQPIMRAEALRTDMRKIAARVALEIDESDDSINAFPAALALGYTGVSSKSCKGFYRGMLNAARVAQMPKARFLSAEDLTVQPGIALQQDLTLAALTGCSHVERNGHHFVGGMAPAPPAEQARFAAAHPDLYETDERQTRLRISDGRIALASTLAAKGLGCAIAPDLSHLTPMKGTL